MLCLYSTIVDYLTCKRFCFLLHSATSVCYVLPSLAPGYIDLDKVFFPLRGLE